MVIVLAAYGVDHGLATAESSEHPVLGEPAVGSDIDPTHLGIGRTLPRLGGVANDDHEQAPRVLGTICGGMWPAPDDRSEIGQVRDQEGYWVCFGVFFDGPDHLARQPVERGTVDGRPLRWVALRKER